MDIFFRRLEFTKGPVDKIRATYCMLWHKALQFVVFRAAKSLQEIHVEPRRSTPAPFIRNTTATLVQYEGPKSEVKDPARANQIYDGYDPAVETQVFQTGRTSP